MTGRIDLRPRTYDPAGSAAFMRSREKYGQLSNMTHGYALQVNGLAFQGPEGLYQALKFPDQPGLQEQIGGARSGMDAKKRAWRDRNIRPDWEEIKVHAMLYTVAVKLAQHPKWSAALEETGRLPIVEMSYRDDFWGAKPDQKETTLTGRNVLGKVLTALRTELRLRGGDALAAAGSFAENVPLERMTVNGRSAETALLA